MTVRCQNGHEIPVRPVVGRNIPALHCWQCAFPPEEATVQTAAFHLRNIREVVARKRRAADEAATEAARAGGAWDEGVTRNIARMTALQEVLDLIDSELDALDVTP